MPEAVPADASRDEKHRDGPRRVLFFRNIRRFTGGHLKTWDYFNHVLSSPDYTATVRFTRRSVRDARNPWAVDLARFEDRGRLEVPDVLFLAGRDWERIPRRWRLAPPCPVVNLVQHVRHADPADRRNPFLAYPAVRICVSQEITDALATTKQVRGPVFTIPNGIDLSTLPAPAGERTLDLLVVANKQPGLGHDAVHRLTTPHRSIRIVDRDLPRSEFLELLATARVTLLVPNETEGFYLPALEGMALGTLVVCPDCVGNRGFCRHDVNCLRPRRSLDEMVEATERALTASPDGVAALSGAAAETVARHDLASERAAFLAVLDQVPDLWAEHFAPAGNAS